ncbi:MAG: hypothetical protein U0599_19660 [Vicinamibacteria bacterium]
MLKLVYVTLSLVPTAAFVTLAVYVVARAVSVRIVWREPASGLDDEPAA